VSQRGIFIMTVLHAHADMWRSIWYWSLLSFGVLHLGAGIVAFFGLRHDGPLRYTLTIPLLFTVLGVLIPCTAGVITGIETLLQCLATVICQAL
jgi:uncharacterized membrane protein HdeD (DUF308 family)